MVSSLPPRYHSATMYCLLTTICQNYESKPKKTSCLFSMSYHLLGKTETKNKLRETRGEVGGDNGGQRGRVFRNILKGHLIKTKGGQDRRWKVGMAGVWGMVGGKWRQLYLYNNKKIKKCKKKKNKTFPLCYTYTPTLKIWGFFSFTLVGPFGPKTNKSLSLNVHFIIFICCLLFHVFHFIARKFHGRLQDILIGINILNLSLHLKRHSP